MIYSTRSCTQILPLPCSLAAYSVAHPIPGKGKFFSSKKSEKQPIEDTMHGLPGQRNPGAPLTGNSKLDHFQQNFVGVSYHPEEGYSAHAWEADEKQNIILDDNKRVNWHEAHDMVGALNRNHREVKARQSSGQQPDVITMHSGPIPSRSSSFADGGQSSRSLSRSQKSSHSKSSLGKEHKWW
jgi:hypothetical protein